MSLGEFLILQAIGLTFYLLYHQGRNAMSAADEVRAEVEAIKAGVAAAVADIQKLHAKLDELAQAGDLEGIRAALAESAAAREALAAAVAIPEPGDEVPPA
jgi:hypothetical protein